MYNHTPLRVSLAGGLLVIFLLSCGRAEKAEPQKLIRPVRYMQVYSTGGRQFRIFSGTARAGVESKLSFKVNGTIRHIPVKLGDTVESGQVIAEMDPTDYQLKVGEAEAALARAAAEARHAEATYKRVRALYENENASRNELDSARAAADSSRAAVMSINKTLELAKRQLGYTRLSAPTRCTIAAVLAEVNENVAAGQPIVQVTCGSRIEVQVAIPEVFIALIHEESRVTVAFDAVPGDTFPAVVSEVGVSATGLATTYPVTVTLQRTDRHIRPGMAANVTFDLGTSQEKVCFEVPLYSVGEDRQGRFVFVIESQEAGRGIVRRRPVEIGELTSKGLEVLRGLDDGDLIVTAGVKRLQDGQEVKLLTAKGS